MRGMSCGLIIFWMSWGVAQAIIKFAILDSSLTELYLGLSNHTLNIFGGDNGGVIALAIPRALLIIIGVIWLRKVIRIRI